MCAMPTPSEHIWLSLEARLDERARAAWPQLQRLHVRHRGAFAYVEAELADSERVKLMRLRYSGAVGRWGFALYLASNERYEDSLLPAGTPQTRSTAPAGSTSPAYWWGRVFNCRQFSARTSNTVPVCGRSSAGSPHL